MKPKIKTGLIFFFLSLVLIFPNYDILHSDPDIPGILVEKDPTDIAINPLTNEAVVTNEKSGSVSVVDLDIEQVIATISVGKKPKGIATDNAMNIAVAANSKDNTVTLIDLNTYETITTVPVGKDPEKVAVNQNTHTALVANHKDDSVSVIDLMTYTVISTIPVEKEPIDIAIDPELNIALVVNEKAEKDKEDDEDDHKDKDKDKGKSDNHDDKDDDGDDDDDDEHNYIVSIIDLNTYEVTGTVSAGKKPKAIDINPVTHIAVVANEKDNTLTIINLLTWESYDIPGEKHPEDVAVNPLDNRALVISEHDRKLILIDLDTDTIVREYSINKESEAVEVNPYTNTAGIVDSKTDSLTLIQLPNPVPMINSINPGTIIRGSSDTSINIEGSRFITSSTVYLDGQALDTAFIDNDNIQAIIPGTLLLTAGAFPVTVVNPAPDGGTSNAVNLQVDNPVPVITLLDPAEAIAGTPSLTVNVNGTGFFDDTTLYVNGISRPLTLLNQTLLQLELTASDLETGGYLEITVSNPEPGGGVSSPAVFTMFNPVPVLTSISPSSATQGSPDFTLTLTGNNFLSTSVVSFNGQQLQTTYINSTGLEAVVPAIAVQASRDYPVKVINPGPGGGQSASLTFTVKPFLEIQITSPSDSETINKTKIIIKGTINSDTNDIGITVNGVIAEIMGNGWIANGVPLTTGTNTITAVVTDSHGNTDSKTITIYTNNIIQYVTLTANITSGISPLTTYFSVSTEIPALSVTYQMDFEGDGVVDYEGAIFENINFTYTTEGIYYPTVTVVDTEGISYSDTIAITVLNKEEINELLKGKWEVMKTALLASDNEGALVYFVDDSTDRYRQAFTSLGSSNINLIFSSITELRLNTISGPIAQYWALRTEPEGTFAYPVTFVLDENGIWKIMGF